MDIIPCYPERSIAAALCANSAKTQLQRQVRDELGFRGLGV